MEPPHLMDPPSYPTWGTGGSWARPAMQGVFPGSGNSKAHPATVSRQVCAAGIKKLRQGIGEGSASSPPMGTAWLPPAPQPGQLEGTHKAGEAPFPHPLPELLDGGSTQIPAQLCCSQSLEEGAGLKKGVVQQHWDTAEVSPSAGSADSASRFKPPNLTGECLLGLVVL